MGGVFAAIGRFFTDVLAKFAQVVEWAGLAFAQVFIDLWELLTDAVVWVFDAFLGLAVAAVGSIDVSGIDTAVDGAWAGVGAEVLNVIGLIGLDYALGIIGVAIFARLGLQLIPFTRLGS